MRFIVLSLLLLTIYSGFAQKSKVDQFFTAGSLKNTSYSIYAVDAKTGTVVCESEQKSLSTASVMKLYTTAVALDLLGPDFTFATSVYYSGSLDAKTGILSGNLLLKGGCDPAFYSAYFNDRYQDCFGYWIKQLKNCGIKKIQGNLLIDLSALDQKSIPGGWAWDDIGNYYGAGVSALSFRDNQYEIYFESSKLVDHQAKIKSIIPEMSTLSLDNKVVSSTKTGDNTIVYGAPGLWHQSIEGTIPVDQTDFVVKAAMPDPPIVAAQVFLKKLQESGVPLSGSITKQVVNDGTKRTLIATWQSPPLKDLIVPLNKESLNLYAEHILREVARRKLGEPTLAKGIEAYQQFCVDKGICSFGFFPTDGSGLSRSNALTAQTMVETMKYIYNSKNWEFFLNSLPVAGVDGTLKNSFKDTPLEKNVHAKTGSMSRVRSVAGTMKTKSGRVLLFAILLNNFDLKSPEVSQLLESILLSFYNEK